jgi:hypothetical protein
MFRFVETPKPDNPKVAGWRAGLLYPLNATDEVTVYRGLDRFLATEEGYSVGILMEGVADLGIPYKAELEEEIKSESEKLMWDFWTKVLHIDRPSLKS